MKIGILTFVNTSNYGAALQAFALQHYFKRCGAECDLIRYDCKRVTQAHDPAFLWKRKGLKKLSAPLLYPIYKKRRALFRKFEEQYLTFSAPCNAQNAQEILAQYDRIVVGSDQVWNTDITGNDLGFFLGSLRDSAGKCSYAASIGRSYFTEAEEKVCLPLLKQFSVLSVREESTREKLAAQLHRTDISCDLDPTLLYPDEWAQFISETNPNGDYIFMYLIPEKPELMAKIRAFAEKEHCGLILLKKGMGRQPGCRIVNVASPADFLNYVYHAKYVISGSFHVLCFSLIFEKDFYMTSSIQPERSARMRDLLTKLGAESRMIFPPEYQIVPAKLDYPEIGRRLAEMRRSSEETAQRILK